jgi:hypothetical protein
MNSLVKRNYQYFTQLQQALQVHARLDNTFFHFSLLYACKIFSVLQVKDLLIDNKQNTPHDVMHNAKPNLEDFIVWGCPFIIKKHTAQKDGEIINMKKEPQRGFRGIFIGFAPQMKGWQAYVPATRKTISSNDIYFDESFTSALVTSSKPYQEALSTRPLVTCIPSIQDLMERTGEIITFAQLSDENNLESTFSDPNDNNSDVEELGEHNNPPED